MTDQTRPHDPTDDPTRTERLDPGAFVGREPERQAETIPGGVREDDERIAANSSQVGGTGREDRPSGHRDGAPASDDQVREAGQDR